MKKKKNIVQIPPAQEALKKGLEGIASDFDFKIAEPHSWSEYGLTVLLKKEQSLGFFENIKKSEGFNFDMLIDITCVDWLDEKEERFEVVYQFLSTEHFHRLCVKIEVPENDAKVDSVLSVWPGANFLEREAWDMYGVEFEGHGDLRRILMYDEFVGHPLRKDYPKMKKQPRVPLRVPEQHNTAKDMRREQLVPLPTRRS